MERAIRNLCVATGLFISATVAMLPLSSYAAPQNVVTDTSTTCTDDTLSSTTPINVNCSRSMDVALNVLPAIEITAVSGITESEAIILSPTEVRTGNFSATVTSNTGYTLSLSSLEDSADGPYMKNSNAAGSCTDSSNQNNCIPALASSATLTGGTAGWGVNYGSGAYQGLTTDLVEYYRSDTIAKGETITFGVGIAAAPNLTQGVYQGTVVITAHAGNS